MPIPALSIQQSAAIALPICLAGYIGQEALLRRRAVKRGAKSAVETQSRDHSEAPAVPDVTTVAVDHPAGGPMTSRKPTPRRRVAAAPRAAAAAGRPVKRGASTPKPTAAKAHTRPPIKAVGPAPRPAAAKAAAGPSIKPAASSATAAAVSKPALPRKPRANRKAAPAESLRARQAALRSGLDAIITFVDAAPRRAAARACADVLLLALPASERGPRVSAYLRGVAAGEAPGRLQDLAEEAGVEVATALRATNAQLKELQ